MSECERKRVRKRRTERQRDRGRESQGRDATETKGNGDWSVGAIVNAWIGNTALSATHALAQKRMEHPRQAHRNNTRARRPTFGTVLDLVWPGSEVVGPFLLLVVVVLSLVVATASLVVLA